MVPYRKDKSKRLSCQSKNSFTLINNQELYTVRVKWQRYNNHRYELNVTILKFKSDYKHEFKDETFSTFNDNRHVFLMMTFHEYVIHLKDRTGTLFATDILHHGHSKSFPVVIIATILLCKSLFCTMMHGSRSSLSNWRFSLRRYAIFKEFA